MTATLSVKDLNAKITELKNQHIDPLLEKGHNNWEPHDTETFMNLKDELDSLQEQRDSVAERDAAVKAYQEENGGDENIPAENLRHVKEQKEVKKQAASLGHLFTASKAFTDFNRMEKKGPVVTFDFDEIKAYGEDGEEKTLIQTSSYPPP